MAAQLAGNLLSFGLKIVPIPYLDTSFSILTAIHASIQHVRGVRAQMTALATSVGELLCHLNVELQGMEHLDTSIQDLLENFNSLLVDISETAEKFSKQSSLKIFFTPTDVQNVIDQHHRKISQMSTNFQMRLQIIIHNDMRKFEENRQTDMHKFDESMQSQMLKFEEARQADMRKIEEARQKDHKELLSLIQDLQKERRFTQAADEAMMDDFPLTEKDIKDYSTTVDETSAERDIVDKMFKCLNRPSVLVSRQYQASNSTTWASEQRSTDSPPSYTYSAEPGAMSEAESQIPLDPPYPHRPNPARRLCAAVHDAYTSYPPPSAPYAPGPWGNYGSESQLYNPFGHNKVQMPTPHHYY